MLSVRKKTLSPDIQSERNVWHIVSSDAIRRRVNANSSGDLGPVICVHGLTRQGRDFDFLAMKLAERRYKVL
jgi:hypothetical protein